MTNLSITLTVLAAWLGLGLVFLSLCRAAGRADDQADRARNTGHPGAPKTLKQHIFAVHARTLRSMRRPAAGHGTASRPGHHRHHGADNGFHSA